MEEKIEELSAKIQEVFAGKVRDNNFPLRFDKIEFIQQGNRVILFGITHDLSVYIIMKEPLYKLDEVSQNFPVYDKDLTTYIATLQKGERPEIHNKEMYEKFKDEILQIQSTLDSLIS